MSPSWHEHAACRGMGPDQFYFDGPGAAVKARKAKKICSACIVKTSCLAEAMRWGDQFGVWGETSTRDRYKLRRQQREAQAS